MASILNFCRRLFKHRKHQRFAVQNGTFVIVSPSTDQERKVLIADISPGGTAFIYQGSPTELAESGFLKMFDTTPTSDRVEFVTVSDIPIPGSTQTSESFRRRGVKFQWMGVLGKAELRDFIKEFSVCPK
jgi:hypothetical protein